MQLYFGGAASERFVLLDIATVLEVRGARDEYRVPRLDPVVAAHVTRADELAVIGPHGHDTL